MVFVEDDHMVQQLAPYGADEALGCSVLPWASESCPLWTDFEALNRVGDGGGEYRIVVSNQVAMSGFVGEGLAQLLDHPVTSWVLANVEVQDPPSTVVDREADVQQSESNRRNDEEIHPGNHVLVIPEEGHPALLLCGVRLSRWHVARHGGEAGADSKLHLLGLDLPRPPAVFARHPDDEGFGFLRDQRLSRSSPRPRTPGAAGTSGGARGGSFRHSRILRATIGSSIAAIRRSVAPHLGHRSASISKKR